MRRLATCLLATLGWVAGSQAASTGPALVRSIELPNVQGRIDHMALDAATGRLYVAALGNGTVEVLDVRAGTHVKSLPGFREPQGIAVVADPHVVAIANGAGAGIQTIDAGDYHLLKNVSLGDDSDNVRYDAAVKRLFVGYASGVLASVDPASGSVIARVSLAAHPESFQLERSGTRIYVNVPNADHIAVIDRTAMKVVATWPVTAAKANFPMALDEGNHRLFIGCRRPAKVLVYDTQTGTLLGSADVVGDTDDLFYDARTNRLYVSGGEGFVDVLDVRDAARIARTARVKTAAGARTSLFSPDSAQLYLAVPRRGTQRAEIRVYTLN